MYTSSHFQVTPKCSPKKSKCTKGVLVSITTASGCTVSTMMRNRMANMFDLQFTLWMIKVPLNLFGVNLDKEFIEWQWRHHCRWPASTRTLGRSRLWASWPSVGLVSCSPVHHYPHRLKHIKICSTFKNRPTRHHCVRWVVNNTIIFFRPISPSFNHIKTCSTFKDRPACHHSARLAKI